MPNKKIAMRKIREILRLRFDIRLSFRQINPCADVSTGAIQKILKRLESSGISWPLPEGMIEPRLVGLLYPESDSRPSALEDAYPGLPLAVLLPLSGLVPASSILPVKCGSTGPVISTETDEYRQAQIFVAVLGASNYT